MDRRSFLTLRSTHDNPSAFMRAMTSQPIISQAGLDEFTSPLNRKTAEHLLRRCGFQYTHATVNALIGKTAREVVQTMLNPSTQDMPSHPNWASTAPINDQALNRNRMLEIRRIWFTQMLNGTNQLQEKMTFFWHNLLTSEEDKVYYPQFMYWQNDIFRRNPNKVSNPWKPSENNDRSSFGNIKTLIKAIVRDAAMLIYLDNGVSVVGNPNENFARELLELYALGIGNYTEKDIIEAARALTGWSITGLFSEWKSSRWDSQEKEFLSEKGNFNSDDIVDIIFKQPACSQFFARRLYQFFVYFEPDQAIVQSLAQELVKENYELKPVLLKLLTSQHFFDEKFYGSMIKSPLDLVIGTARMLTIPGIKVDYGLTAMAALNLDLLNPPDVEGFKMHHNWITTTTLPTRQKFTNGILDGKTYDGQNAPELKVDVLAFMKNFPEAINAEEVIKAVAGYMIPFELSENIVKGWIDDIFGGYDWTITSPNANAEVKVRLLLRNIMQLPEFQLM